MSQPMPGPSVLANDPAWEIIQIPKSVSPATTRAISEMQLTNTIVIDDMSHIIGSNAIEFAFGSHGIVRIHFVVDDKMVFLGRVMVEFAKEESAKDAAREMNGEYLCMRQMKIRMATDVSNLNEVVFQKRQKKRPNKANTSLTPQSSLIAQQSPSQKIRLTYKPKTSMSPLSSQQSEESPAASMTSLSPHTFVTPLSSQQSQESPAASLTPQSEKRPMTPLGPHKAEGSTTFLGSQEAQQSPAAKKTLGFVAMTPPKIKK